MKISFSCNNCGKQYSVSESMSGKSGKCKDCGSKITVPNILSSQYNNSSETNMQRYTEYKVITVEEGGCGTLVFGSSKIPGKKMENTLNKLASEGWQVVFQIVEQRRMLLFWTRESVIITLGR